MTNLMKTLLEEHDYFERAEHLVDVPGMSTPRVCNLLNKLVAQLKDDEYYLEIGTWQGLTICSAAYQNQGKNCIACDKFRFYGTWTGWGFKVRRKLREHLRTYSQPQGAHVVFHDMDSKRLFKRDLVPHGVKVYFYDGDHTYEGTRHNVLMGTRKMCDESYLLVDDWNDEVIRRATLDALAHSEFEVTWSRDLEGENGNPDGWWNGLGVFALSRRA